MGDIFLTDAEGKQVDDILKYGFETPTAPKWWAVNVAIARSLAMDGIPGEEFGRPPSSQGKGGEIHLEQILGKKSASDDIEDGLKLILSIKHGVNLFEDENLFVDLLQKHARRGLKEIRAVWRKGNDFHNFLYQDFFYSLQKSQIPVVDNNSSLHKAMQQLGLSYELIGEPLRGPRITRYIMRMQSIDGLAKLRSNLEKLKFVMGGLPNMPVIIEQDSEKTLALDIPRPSREWRTIPPDVIVNSINSKSSELPICLGVTPIGESFVFDLSEEPHMFIAGATGMGKSTCLHAILFSLKLSKRPLQFLLIDPKKVEFAPYSRLNNLYGNGICTAPHDAYERLLSLRQEMEKREQIFVKLGVVKLSDAVSKGHELPRIVVIIEELADLILKNPDIEEPLIELAAKGRAAGIHLILATQRPDAATFRGLLRSNIPCRVAMFVQSASHSRIILDESGAEELLGKGDMLLKRAAHKIQRLHGAFVQPTDVVAIK